MQNNSGFYALGIAPSILTTLDKLGFTTPTPIQDKSIPSAIEGKDMIGLAQTGTGKTLAFGIPLLQAALQGKKSLVLVPTRELALQVQESLDQVGLQLGIRSALIIGGSPMGRQLQALSRGPLIVVATPGRMVDHMEQGTISTKNVSILVLDEADRMLDMGFAPQLKRIITGMPEGKQTLLFSATMPDEIVRMAKSTMKLPLRIEITPPGTANTKVTQEVFFVSKMDKIRLLEKILLDYKGPVLVFSRTKFGAKKIASAIRHMGHKAAEIHSNKSLGQRREALEGFRSGAYRVLVATDIAARGIDVKGIELVVNFDLPDNPDDYVHRIGRTARAGASGHAISFATPDQRRDVFQIERLMRVALPQQQAHDLPPARSMPHVEADVERSHSPRAPRGPRSYAPRKPYHSGGAHRRRSY